MGFPTNAILGKNYTFTVQARDGWGAATDSDALPTYSVYEDETSTAIATGTMSKLDDAGTAGFYSEQLTVTEANGYENYKSYTVRVAYAVTTGGASRSTTVNGTFMILGSIIAAAAVSEGDGATLSELKDICIHHGWHDQTTNGLAQLTNFINHTCQILVMLAPWPEFEKKDGYHYLNASVTSAVNDASATTTSFDTDLTDATNDTYNNRILVFTSGEWRRITDYVGSTKVITVSPALSAAPDDNDAFTMYDCCPQLDETLIARLGNVVRSTRSTPLEEYEDGIDGWIHDMVYHKGTGPTTRFALNKYTSSGAIKIDMCLYPKPTAAEHLYYTYRREINELSSDSDQTLWPSTRTWLLAEALRSRLAAVNRDAAAVVLYSPDFMTKVNMAFNQARPSYMPVQAKPMARIRPGKWKLRDIEKSITS